MDDFQIPYESEVPEVFGEVGCQQTTIDLPYPMKLAWQPATEVNRLTCHNLIAPRMGAIFADVLAILGEDGIAELGLDMYGGCLNVRDKRGGGGRSMHSWGIAVDMDPARNKLRWRADRARLAQPDADPFWRIVERYGGVSLGRVKGWDYMHFQFAKVD